MEYHYCESLSGEAVELKVDDSHGKLIHILKLTDGEEKMSSVAFNNHQKLDVSWHNHCLKRILIEYL